MNQKTHDKIIFEPSNIEPQSFIRKNNIVKALKQSVLFQALSEDALRSIAGIVKTRQYFPDETIVWQGNPSDSLYLITNGIVAVKRIISAEKEHILAYLMPGNTFGEVGILENQPRSATVSAISDVDAIVIRRNDFFDIMQQYPSVAIELAKMLGRYLVESNRRASRGNKKARLVLVLCVMRGIGGSTVGNMVARMLQQKTQRSTIYTEYPSPQDIVADLDIDKKTKIYKHKSGYDILVSQEDNFLSSSARTTLMLDSMMSNYDNNVICVKSAFDENINTMLDYANQIIILTPPTKEAFKAVQELQKNIKKYVRPDETNVFTLINRCSIEHNQTVIEENYDFEIPYLEDFPSIKESGKTEMFVPEKVGGVIDVFVDRLERTNQVSVYIPTTLDVNQSIDTSKYVEDTLKFLAERFGGATSKQAQGVWNSDEMGLVGETVYIVHTYATQADMNNYLDDVVEYIKKLKVELKQEAMALEVNKKLALI